MVGCEGGGTNLEKGLGQNAGTPSEPPTPKTPTLVLSGSGKTLLVSNSSKSLIVSNSGKRIDKKKFVKQVTGRHNDTELHLAAQRGDLAAVKQILGEIDSQMVGTLSGAEFDAEVLNIRSAIVNEVNELGETALFSAAEKGHLNVVKELLQYTTEEGILLKNRSGFDPLHIAASQGHQGNPLNLILWCNVIFCLTIVLFD
jgi:ankyrin repeat protein